MAAPIRLIRQGFPDAPGLDTALSRALLLRASMGDVGETFRLSVPGPIVAFGKMDKLEPGYDRAVAAARGGGFEAIERLTGGRPAVFHEGTLAFSWTIPTPDPAGGIRDRFTVIAALMVRAFSRLGVASSVGEVPGEYCPGEFSVHAADDLKLMGVGQRLARGAAHVGGVIVVNGSRRIRKILLPVNSILGLDWRPETAGSIEDVQAEVTMEAAANAVIEELGDAWSVRRAEFEADTLALGRSLAPQHVAAS